MKKIKKISIKEFRERGYLQELNRRFLHPLGLALEVKINKNEKESLGGVWDYRNEKEGIYYGLNTSKFTNTERLKLFKKKFDYIEQENKNRFYGRKKKLGFFIEPIPDK